VLSVVAIFARLVTVWFTQQDGNAAVRLSENDVRCETFAASLQMHTSHTVRTAENCHFEG
jgi:hypothetical protein